MLSDYDFVMEVYSSDFILGVLIVVVFGINSDDLEIIYDIFNDV